MDISGRHEEDGRYLMVCSAVEVELTAHSIDSVEGMDFEVRDTERKPSFEVVAETIQSAAAGLGDVVVVSEEGEFYGKPEWVVEGALESEFKYVESIGERKAVDLAHHAAYAARKLVYEGD